MSIIYHHEGFLKIEDAPELRCLVFHWESFSISLEDIQRALYFASDALKERGYREMIVDSSYAMGVFTPDLVQWWEEVMIGRYVAAGAQAIITVVPSSFLGKLATEFWQKHVVSEGSMCLQNVASMSDAHDVVREIQRTAGAGPRPG